MKLAFCPICKDIFKLTGDVRSCQCGKSSGVLKNRTEAHVNGPLKMLGINDKSLYEALAAQPTKGAGKEFSAFVLPKVNKSTVRIVSKQPAPPLRPLGVTEEVRRISPFESQAKREVRKHESGVSVP